MLKSEETCQHSGLYSEVWLTLTNILGNIVKSGGEVTNILGNIVKSGGEVTNILGNIVMSGGDLTNILAYDIVTSFGGSPTFWVIIRQV
jgi:hypothetical protein